MRELTLQHIRTMPVGELCALSEKSLVLLIAEAQTNIKQSKLMKRWLDAILLFRHERRHSDEDTIHLEDVHRCCAAGHQPNTEVC